MGAAAVPLIMMAVGTGAQVYNQRRTEKKQDQQLASSIRNQSAKQREADARVSKEVEDLEKSTSRDERNKALDDYMRTIALGKKKAESGLDPDIGSATFQADAQGAREGMAEYAGRTADFMAREDAPRMQRQGEAFGFGKLATDIGMIGRESRGDAFIDEMRMRMIRMNPWIQAGGSLLQGAGSTMLGGGLGWGKSGANSAAMTPVQYGGKAVYGALPGGRYT
jgi:hypothetical protein